jgi:hypothetical protein
LWNGAGYEGFAATLQDNNIRVAEINCYVFGGGRLPASRVSSYDVVDP